jgi:Chaperone of endosialidase
MKNRSITFTIILSMLTCLAVWPATKTFGVVPPPDGGYPGFNTAEGQNALFNLDVNSGLGNTAVGWFSLWSNAEGSFNTATGAGALLFNNGDQNTALGVAALLSNTTGSFNTATGVSALSSNTIGVSNNAFGWGALLSNTTGNNNTAIGVRALQSNTQGIRNVAVGETALSSNTFGGDNTAIGFQALFNNTTGVLNTAIGRGALHDNTTGGANTALGWAAGFNITGDGNVCIGSGVSGVAGESGTTRIANIYASVAGDRAVYVNSDNKLGTMASSRRFKQEIKPMDKASEVLFALKPVSFRYKKEFDAGRAPMFGLIAEDVEQVDPDLVSRNEKGEVETVRYEQINAMLLNEFLKAHRREGKLQSTVAQQQKEIQALTAELKEQAAHIQKVSAQLQAANRGATVVLNSP